MILYLYHVNSGTYHIVRDSMILGRTSGHLKFEEDNSMSSQHVQLVLDRSSNTVFVTDLNSRNHTVVDRVEITPQQKVPMKLHSLLEVGMQRFIIFDNRNASKDVISGILEEKQKIHITKMIGSKIVGDLKNRLAEEIKKLQQEELDYKNKIHQAEEDIASYKTHIHSIHMQLQDRMKRLDKLKDGADSATRTLLKKA